jgi:uncharacterized protein
MYLMSWNELEGLCLELEKKIKDSGKESQIDLIVCISRGGLFLGRVLSEMLNKPLAVISARYQGTRYTVDDKISSLCPIKGNILLVDDVMEEVVNDIVKVIKKNKAVTSITLACLFYRKQGKNFTPSYSINEIHKEIWVTFPYQAGCLKGHRL